MTYANLPIFEESHSWIVEKYNVILVPLSGYIIQQINIFEKHFKRRYETIHRWSLQVLCTYPFPRNQAFPDKFISGDSKVLRFCWWKKTQTIIFKFPECFYSNARWQWSLRKTYWHRNFCLDVINLPGLFFIKTGVLMWNNLYLDTPLPH